MIIAALFLYSVGKLQLEVFLTRLNELRISSVGLDLDDV
jgi:hypothetical protein